MYSLGFDLTAFVQILSLISLGLFHFLSPKLSLQCYFPTNFQT